MLIDKNILRLDVPVDDPGSVAEHQCLGDVQSETYDITL